MTAIIYLLMCLLYFVCVGIDVVMFFLQVRLVLLWRSISWLVPFDNAGKTLVNTVTTKVPQFLKTRKQLSEKGKLIAALIAFAIARIILGVILRLT
jgi:hypothetical protein